MLQLDPANAAVLERHVRAETSFDMEATLATLAPDCLFEDMPTGTQYRGRDGARAYYREWWDAFGNVPQGSRLYVPAGDCLIVETRFVGTHRGAFQGVPASGRPIDLPLVIVVRFADGLMSGERFYYDRATLLAQIGAAR